MNKYELIAKVSKYTAIVGTIYILGRFGLNINFEECLIGSNSK